MDFKPVELADREIINRFTTPSSLRICDISFSNLYGWSTYYHTCWAVIEDHLVVRFQTSYRNHPVYLCPVSPGGCDLRAPLRVLEEMAMQGDYPLTLMGITPQCREALEKSRPGEFYFINDRAYYDYIYLREQLCTLSGKKLQSKRNHINKFERNYPDWKFELITPQNAMECMEIEKNWIGDKGHDQGRENELRMIGRILRHIDELGVTGGAIRVNGEIVAFSIGSPINHDTFGVHIEKGSLDYEGAFAMINREFARNIPENYLYINREEDLGLEGLRKSKLSYQPEILLPKETAILRHENK